MGEIDVSAEFVPINITSTGSIAALIALIMVMMILWRLCRKRTCTGYIRCAVTRNVGNQEKKTRRCTGGHLEKAEKQAVFKEDLWKT